jgi:alpha-tubulin suppressor-like RCC1 family protein/tRNA A-37 threonylcarbamoyl transferase component Bud32
MSSERTPTALTALEPEYWILGEIGRGGTAIVYLARDRATGEEVAIKLIRPKYIDDEEAIARFAREARFVTQLNHPNVVGVHRVMDLGAGGIALIMAHIDGRTLKQVIKEEHPLSPGFVVGILRQVAAALAAAHRLGIVHRDVKPENIFIDSEGKALLADFGVARSMSGDTQLTMHGVAIGTPSYMAPEQIDGDNLDGRADVYSLGLVAWEMLTGHRPWEGESLYAVLYHQRHHELPEVRELRPDVSDQLADAIAGAIEKEPTARWQSMDELIDALDGAAPHRHAQAHVPVSTETIRFSRPAGNPFTPGTDLARTEPAPLPTSFADVPAAPPVVHDGRGFEPSFVGAYFTPEELEELELPPARRFPLSRRQTALAAAVLIGVLGLGVVAKVVEGRSDATPSLATARPTRAVASGDVTRQSSNPVALLDSLATDGEPAAIPESLSVASAIAPADSGSPAATDTSAPDARVGVELKTKVAEEPPPVAAERKTPPPPKSAEKKSSAVTAPATKPETAAPAASAAPVAPPPSRSRVSVVAGGLHTCLVAADGRAFCWGGNDQGQLGVAGGNRLSAPSPVGADLRFTAIAPGLAHSCAIARGGALWCWGENEHGQLGDRSQTARGTPVRAAVGYAFRAVAAGAAHTCGLTNDGSALCWGSDSHGQLGDGGTADRASPVAVLGSQRFVSLDVGWNFTCGLADGGKAWCWGDNSAGQLGDGTTTNRRQPTPVQGAIGFQAVTAGSAHACGITPSGEAYCWGRNASGELGDGSTSPRSTPVRVRTDEQFVSIAAGAVHTCAVASDGEAWCWGRNTYGQLGNGGTTDSGQPVKVAGGHTFTSVRAFGSHTCGTTVSGEAFCWGYNSDGQLGDGTRTHRTRPVYVERPGG